jgi:hypothetical protein
VGNVGLSRLYVYIVFFELMRRFCPQGAGGRGLFAPRLAVRSTSERVLSTGRATAGSTTYVPPGAVGCYLRQARRRHLALALPPPARLPPPFCSELLALFRRALVPKKTESPACLGQAGQRAGRCCRLEFALGQASALLADGVAASCTSTSRVPWSGSFAPLATGMRPDPP